MSAEQITTKTATKVKEMEGWQGDAAVYRLDPPLDAHEFVVVSSVTLGISLPNYRSSETMVFPSDGEDATDFGELTMIPYMSHEDALADLGYEVAA